MVTSPWLAVALAAVGLPGAVGFVDFCPARCIDAGPNTGNWSVYPNFNRIQRCQQTMFYSFSMYDLVDEPDATHRIAACSSFGTDFVNMEPESSASQVATSAKSADVNFELGWWHEGFGLAKPAIRSLTQQMREYISNGHGPSSDRPFILYGRSAQATIGVYIGQGLPNQAISDSALRTFQDSLDTLDITTPSLAMQLCGAGYDSTQTFGIMVTSNAIFNPIQKALQSWANATCLRFVELKEFPSRVTFTLPLVNTTSLNSTTATNSTVRARASFMQGRRVALQDNAVSPVGGGHLLQKRADCRTIQVNPGNGCADLAVRCGISGADFTKYNPNICATLKPKQHVCCSEGDLPDFSPKPQPNGDCFAYTVAGGDSCDSIAAEFSLTREKLEEFNKKTWGFAGCEPLFEHAIICLSKGNPPFPAPIANANCGPQKLGSKPPTDGSNIADLNPCPLNACCNIWGQCGITTDFCIDTNTGAPGTAKPGTYGCISNCGVDVVKGTGNGAIKLAYFQGYGMGRPCLYQDALQIDTSKYSHVHFGFGTLTPSYEPLVGDLLSSYQFGEFKRIRNAKRILSFGGWAFSNDLATYKIFREGVKPANRLTMARNIANFIIKHDLDGVDIDWEYPGAPDLPNMSDPGKAEDGPNYLAFLAVLKNLLPGKTVAIAAPASYWYLKQFPIKEIGRIVDYIVYMTYDLHGQWDAHNEYSQENCPTGNCLRSQVNLTETRQALAMITKAGVPGNKIVVGVTSYGRSFNMAQPGCWGPSCTFTGGREHSDATPGRCTGTGGYLADAEINEIISGDPGRVTTRFLDTSSNSDILVYDNNQWVGYMSESTKAVRTRLYASWGMAGTTDWASDLQEFHDPPKPAKSWASFIELARAGDDPKESDLKLGKWREFTCTAPETVHPTSYTAKMRWEALDAKSAWREIIDNWKNLYKDQHKSFDEAVQITLDTPLRGCGIIGGPKDLCDGVTRCEDSANGKTSGPAAELIEESLTAIHKTYHSYYSGIVDMMATTQTTIRRMEIVFAPVPEPQNNQWLNVMIDLITIGALGSAAPFFNTVLKTLPAMAKGSTFDNTKDTALMLIGQGTSLAKDMLQADEAKWSADGQKTFSDYAAQIMLGWQDSASLALEQLFSGTDEAIDRLTSLLADGKFARGKWEGTGDREKPPGAVEIQKIARKAFFGFAIPGLWRRSSAYVFILQSGEGCSGNPASKYVSDSTAEATKVCVNDKLYYLVHPDGQSRDCAEGGCIDNKFQAPKGLDSLKNSDFGGVTKEDIVRGALATWEYNGRENKAVSITELAGRQEVRGGLVDLNVNTPGVVQLPVCSGDRAFQSWDKAVKGGSPFYPCDAQPGRDHCGTSTFENQGSGASPLVSDCRQLIRNIEGDPATEFMHSITGHREILKHGSCRFGIERTGGTGGAVQFMVGGQDVIDLINDSIRMFGGGGRVGAKGVMSCTGTTVGTKVDVLWGIY